MTRLTHDTDIALLFQPTDQTFQTLLCQFLSQTLGFGVAVRKVVGRVCCLLTAAFSFGAGLGTAQLADIKDVDVELEPLRD